jgi:hypothetical protein
MEIKQRDDAPEIMEEKFIGTGHQENSFTFIHVATRGHMSY